MSSDVSLTEADEDSAYYSCIDSPQASLAKEAPTEGQERRRARVLDELLSTERSYVQDLKNVLAVSCSLVSFSLCIGEVRGVLGPVF